MERYFSSEEREGEMVWEMCKNRVLREWVKQLMSGPCGKGTRGFNRHVV